jgi:hypothetical protein
MAPYLEHSIDRVVGVTEEIAARLDPNDTTLVTLADLEARGLVVAEDERQIYGKVVDSLAAELPTPVSTFGLMGGVRMPTIVSPITLSAELRRLDESIQDEQELHGRLRILRAEVTRLRAVMDLAGRPVGVSPAIVILGVYSGVGIVAPVLVLALHPKVLARWQLWTLFVVFIAGLFAVLAYVLWSARTLSRPAVGDDNEPTGS